MSVFWHCDMCGLPTKVNAKYEPILDKDKKPLMTKLRTMDFSTNEVKEYDVPQLKFLEPKAIIVKLNVGDQAIQRDLCQDCVKAHLPQIEALWDILEKIGDK